MVNILPHCAFGQRTRKISLPASDALGTCIAVPQVGQETRIVSVAGIGDAVGAAGWGGATGGGGVGRGGATATGALGAGGVSGPMMARIPASSGLRANWVSSFKRRVI